MSGGFNNPIVGGGGALVYPAIHSPNFSVGPPLVGWSVDKSGDAFFANLTLSGTFNGLDWYLNSSGLFFYNGTPALGNPPVISITPPGTTVDQFGNSIDAIFSAGVQEGAHLQIDEDGLLNVFDTTETIRMILDNGSGARGEVEWEFYDGSGALHAVLGFDTNNHFRLAETNQQTGNPARAYRSLDLGGDFFYKDLGTGSQGPLVAAITNAASVSDPLNGTTLAEQGYTGPVYAQEPGSATQEDWHEVFTGFPAGWTGHVSYRKLADSDLVMWDWAFSIANGTVVTDGESVYTGAPLAYCYQSDNKELPGFLGSASAPAQINSNGTNARLEYNGSGFTSSGTSFWYGQGIMRTTG